MAIPPEHLAQLEQRLEVLLQQQENFSKEIQALKQEIMALRYARPEEEPKPVPIALTPELPLASPKAPDTPQKAQPLPQPEPVRVVNKKAVSFLNLEKFIGESLISKIGIIITIIGVSIGVKYAIDRDLISPLMRILLGYLSGGILLGFAVYLKKRYLNFSAVLMGGALAIPYFITYAAYSFYQLFPQWVAFALMVLLTVGAVYVALLYSRQIIAHIGLVGAYVVPILLSDGQGRIMVLFSYMALINTGILVIAFRRNWKPLFYSAFVLSWIIYGAWVAMGVLPEKLLLGLLFLGVFFSLFYLTFLAYKLIRKELFIWQDTIILLSNAFIAYGLGYALLNSHEPAQAYLGTYTLCHAFAHLMVNVLVYWRKREDQNLFLLLAGLVILYFTIAVPVQLDGNWVTLLWTGEAVLLFWLGRTRNLPAYEGISYALVLLGVFSLLHDWTIVRLDDTYTPILNKGTLTGLFCLSAFGWMGWQHRKTPPAWNNPDWKGLVDVLLHLLPVLVLYFTFFLEIAHYWGQLINTYSLFEKGYFHADFYNFKVSWLFAYTILFLSSFSWLGPRKPLPVNWHKLLVIINSICMGLFLFYGLYALSELRDSFLRPPFPELGTPGISNILMRYLLLALLGLLSFLNLRLHKLLPADQKSGVVMEMFMHVVILWVCSSELIHILDCSGYQQTYKLGLSILWGIYALWLIVQGIWQRKSYLRFSGIGWFGITLLKLFFYDIANLNTLSKTVVFVSLGALLLIASFLYNKYKGRIADSPNGGNTLE